MMKNGCRIGGEQSGHIIFSKYASTGDGILKLTSHEERLSTSLITPILLPSGECLAVVVYIR